MSLTEMITALSDPAAYPFAATDVELHQTHISLVFLVGDFAYKIKKPVSLGFLDFSTVDRRKHFCEEEVRLNRRLAPSVYLGVVPITREAGRLRVEGTGEPIDWAVKMIRLPAQATLEQRIESGEIETAELTTLAEVIARFHCNGASSAEITYFGTFDVIAGNARDNFDQARPEVGITVHPEVLERLRRLMENTLTKRRPLIESRAARGVPRDTHGDLHLDHVYHFPDRPPPDDWQIVDCIEFSERFRYADPIADMAFIVMDLKFHHRPDLAQAFADAYSRNSGDEEGLALVPFYTTYRSIVRAKVGGIKLRAPEVSKRERSTELIRAKAHWLLALGELEESSRKPCLLMIGGLSGTGKSTLARMLAERHGFVVIRSDLVRKDLARQSPPCDQEESRDLYSKEWTERTYAECLRQMGEQLEAGKRVIVDATFGDEQRRSLFFDAARELCVPAHWFDCQADPDRARERISARRNDPSDATWDVYQLQASRWESPSEKTRLFHHFIDANPPPEVACAQAESVLRFAGLL